MREDDFKNGLGDDREYDAGGDTADVLIGSLLEESWLTVEQVAAACAVEPDWLLRHLEEGLLPGAESVAGRPFGIPAATRPSMRSTSMPGRSPSHG